MTANSHIEKLHATLGRRDTPETVAFIIRDALPKAQHSALRPKFNQILANSVKDYFGWSAMATTFAAVETARPQAVKAHELATIFFGGPLSAALPEPPMAEDDEAAFWDFIERFDDLIGKAVGKSNFASDRLDRAGRKALGLSRRRYSKLFRIAQRLESKVARQREGSALRALLLAGKAGLAPRLTIKDFNEDVGTAAFVAYYAARMKLRSEFTIDGQQRPFDEISAALLDLCERNPHTSWWAVAHVFPRADVLKRLTDEERGQLLGVWFGILQTLADRLDDVRQRTAIDVKAMVVRKGNDSSTWNLLAGAWNRARDHWIALICAMDMDALFDVFLPGKVMKLIAADVAAWHRQSGGGLHPDTQVWASLPEPWLVLRGEASCTRADVANACRHASVDPEKSGWIAPRPLTHIAAFRPTPELVYGVGVCNPYLARYLKDIGAFSGKPIKWPAVDTDL